MGSPKAGGMKCPGKACGGLGRAGVCPCPPPCQEVTLDVADVTLCALTAKGQASTRTKNRPQDAVQTLLCISP